MHKNSKELGRNIDDMTESDSATEIYDYHFREYGHKPAGSASSPGLLPLLGEYTLPVGGCAVFMAMTLRSGVSVSLRQDDIYRFFAVNQRERKKCATNTLKFKKEDRWSNSMKGSIAALRQEGCGLRGANVTLMSDIPDDAGFLSTASIILACLAALCAATGFQANEAKRIDLAHWVEARYLEGESSILGIQALLGAKRNGFAIADAAADTLKSYSFGASRFSMLLTDSGVSNSGHAREMLSSLGESERCLEELSGGRHENSLRLVSSKDIEDARGAIPEPIRRKGAFLLEEMHRVRIFEDAFGRKNPHPAWKAVRKSHEALRDMLEISCPEVDWIVKRAEETEGVFASRMVGKGTGGYVITILRSDSIPAFLGCMDEYERIFGFKPSTREVGTDDGIAVL